MMLLESMKNIQLTHRMIIKENNINNTFLHYTEITNADENYHYVLYTYFHFWRMLFDLLKIKTIYLILELINRLFL